MTFSKQDIQTPKYRIIPLPNKVDERGSLCVVDNIKSELPFEVKRVFWIYGVPSDQSRGKHAHHTCAEIVIPVSGSFVAHVTDGQHSDDIQLSNPSEALYIPEMVWCSFTDFSEDCVCLCMASEPYNAEGYINNLEDFLKEVAR